MTHVRCCCGCAGRTADHRPGEFLPAAERLGLIHLIDYWVIERALEAARYPDLIFDINLSGVTIDDTRPRDSSRDQLRERGTEPHRIVFELTETAAVGNIGKAREMARRSPTSAASSRSTTSAPASAPSITSSTSRPNT